MRVTRLRNKQGMRLDANELAVLITRLEYRLHRAGFITEVSRVNSSSIKIGQHMRCFTIDVAKHGYNARVNEITQTSCKLGFKRTSSPTWSQREAFNHVVNNVLDGLKIQASIRSGEYTVRDFETGRVDSWDMPEVFHNGFRLQVPSVLEIVPLKYAAEAVEWVGINAPFVAVVPEEVEA